MSLTPETYAKDHSEDSHQIALFMWAALPETQKQYPELKWLFAIPNGGTRDKREAGKFKAAGVKSGVPDICFPFAKAGFHGLFIELKRPGDKTTAKGRASGNQNDWLEHLRLHGYAAIVCYGWVEARNALINYITNDGL